MCPLENTPDPTLLLTRGEVGRLLDPAELLAPMREAFRAYSMERSVPARRERSPLPGSPGGIGGGTNGGTAIVLFPGLVPGVPAYAVKVHAKFPGQAPAIRGVLHLHDLGTGGLLALMDSTLLTAVRTGIAGAVAADVLAREDAEIAAVVGAGAQGRLQLRCLALVREIRRAAVYDLDPAKAEVFTEEMGAELGLPVAPAPTVGEAAVDADVVLSATWSRAPLFAPGMLKPGAHLATLGPDEPGKAEASAELLKEALFVCDDRELAVAMGAAGGVGLGEEAVDAELGEVIAGQKPGRSDPEQITVFGGVGLAFQDLVAAWRVYGPGSAARSICSPKNPARTLLTTRRPSAVTGTPPCLLDATQGLGGPQPLSPRGPRTVAGLSRKIRTVGAGRGATYVPKSAEISGNHLRTMPYMAGYRTSRRRCCRERRRRRRRGIAGVPDSSVLAYGLARSVARRSASAPSTVAMNQLCKRSQTGLRASQADRAPAPATMQVFTVRLIAIWVNPRARDWARTDPRPGSTNCGSKET